MKKLPKLSRKRQYLCADCAEALGGVWPPGHCATVSISKCDYCKEEKATCSIGDYNWPKDSFLDLRD